MIGGISSGLKSRERSWPFATTLVPTPVDPLHLPFSSWPLSIRCHGSISLDNATEIQRYIASGEPLDKAGAYGIQGRAGMFVEYLAGSYSGMMSLPLFETANLLKRFDFLL